jgi:hypothetical protein
MAFTTSTSPSEDIIVQEGTFAFDYDSSGSVYKGQGVYAIGTLQAIAPTHSLGGQQPGCIGVAAYDQTDGNPVAVYGPGNICRVIISGSSKCTVGDTLFLTDEGKFYNTPHYPSGVYAVALETQATADGTARVLLV